MDLSQRKEAKPDGSAEKGGGGSHTLAGLVKPIPAPYAPAWPFLLICRLAASAYSRRGTPTRLTRDRPSTALKVAATRLSQFL